MVVDVLNVECDDVHLFSLEIYLFCCVVCFTLKSPPPSSLLFIPLFSMALEGLAS